MSAPLNVQLHPSGTVTYREPSLAASGVATVPPPLHLREQIEAQVSQTLGALPPDAKGAIVTVATRNSRGEIAYNLAIIGRPAEHLEIMGYVAKTWGESVPDVGGAVRWAW